MFVLVDFFSAKLLTHLYTDFDEIVFGWAWPCRRNENEIRFRRFGYLWTRNHYPIHLLY